MTLEGQNPAEDQTPAPPASTRWSEDAHEDADVLLPPYIPGRAAPQPAARAEQADPEAADEVPSIAPAEAEAEGGSSDPWAEPAEPSRFAAPEPEAVAGTVEPERSASVEPESEEEADSPSGDYPWDAGGSDEAYEPESEPEPEPASAYPSEPDFGEGPERWASPSEGEEEFPVGAFDIEGAGGDPGGEQRAETEEPSPSATLAAGSDAMADRVERLAEALRREGRPGVERAMASEDRLTSLLAGVLAGYLAAREE